MAFKPPLTRDQLVQIQERNKDSADVFALLWEIKRLRAVITFGVAVACGFARVTVL
jgi:hypothetical protein